MTAQVPALPEGEAVTLDEAARVVPTAMRRLLTLLPN
jgi:hypothetical protein